MTDKIPEVDVAQALHATQQELAEAHAALAASVEARADLSMQLASVQQTLAGATAALSPADRLVEAYRLVEEDKAAKKIAYDAEVAAAQAAHQAELDFIRSCTPQQVQQAGIVIGPQTTHETIYARLRAIVGE